MKESQRCAVKQLMSRAITSSQFIKEFEVDIAVNPSALVPLLEIAYNEKNASDLDLIMYVGFAFNLFNYDYIDVLSKLLIEDWHYKHEDIVSVFEDLTPPEVVDILYQTAFKKYKYLACDGDYNSLSQRCLWALRKINTSKALEKLLECSKSDDPYIRKEALMHLEQINSPPSQMHDMKKPKRILRSLFHNK